MGSCDNIIQPVDERRMSKNSGRSGAGRGGNEWQKHERMMSWTVRGEKGE